MKIWSVIAVAVFVSFPATANCIPPWQTHFACDIPEREARVEFCRIMATKDHPGRKEAYYTYAVGSKPTELYFETDLVYFSTKDTDIHHPTDLSMAMGYARGNYVYAFVTTEDKRDDSRIKAAEIRVYSSIDAFTNLKADTHIAKMTCAPSSIVANKGEIRP